MVVVVGVLGLLVGYVFGAAREPAPPAPLEAAGLSGIDLDDRAVASFEPTPQTTVVAPDENTPQTTAAPTTTTAPAPRLPLGEQVPGFTGTITYVDYGGFSPRLFKWHSRASEPSQADVPAGSWNHQWSAFATHVLYIAGNRSPALYAGSPGRAEPLALWVTSAAWHATDPSRLAWLAPTDQLVDRETFWNTAPTLTTLDMGGTGAAEQIITLTPDDRYDHTEWYLAAWNDDGFALHQNSWSDDPNEHGTYEWSSSIVVIDHDGDVVFQEQGVGGLATLGDGSMVIIQTQGNDEDRNPRLLRLDGTVSATELDPGAWFAAISPDGFYTAHISGSGRLSIAGPVGTVTFSHIVETAAWSPDGRFLVASISGGSVILFYDRVTAQEYFVRPEGMANSLRVH